jgi:hypothetical protein
VQTAFQFCDLSSAWRGTEMGPWNPETTGFNPPLADQRTGQRVTGEGRFMGQASRFPRNGAAQESNLPSVGLRRRTGFEDKLPVAVDSRVCGRFAAALAPRTIVCATAPGPFRGRRSGVEGA